MPSISPTVSLTFTDGATYELRSPVLPLASLTIPFGEEADPNPVRLTVVGWDETIGQPTVLSCALADSDFSTTPVVLVWSGVRGGKLRILDTTPTQLGLACDNHPTWPRGYNVEYWELPPADLAEQTRQQLATQIIGNAAVHLLLGLPDPFSGVKP